MTTPDNGLLNMGVSMDWVKPVPSPMPVPTEQDFWRACELVVLMARRVFAVEQERDMLARRLQAYADPQPTDADMQRSEQITAAIRAMQVTERIR